MAESEGREEAEERKKKRSRRRLEGDRRGSNESGERERASSDPLVAFGADVMTKILSLLDARSVLRSLVVSRCSYQAASSDRLWAPKCEELWKGKAHIPCLLNVRGASKLAAYSMSIIDGLRTRIMKEDLCDHVWEFRFRESAPQYWRNLDPSWNGTGTIHRYFHPNGSHTADPDDEVWGGHECTFSIVTSYVGEGHIREHYVRINRWPSMTVARREDWSWELSNNLYCYNSVPDPEKKGGTGPFFPVW